MRSFSVLAVCYMPLFSTFHLYTGFSSRKKHTGFVFLFCNSFSLHSFFNKMHSRGLPYCISPKKTKLQFMAYYNFSNDNWQVQTKSLISVAGNLWTIGKKHRCSGTAYREFTQNYTMQVDTNTIYSFFFCWQVADCVFHEW